MKNIIRNKSFYLILFFDSCLIIGSLLLAYVLRFEGNIPAHEWEHFYSAVPYILLLKLISFWFFGLYKGMYRYTSLVDLFNVMKATLTSSAIIVLGILFLYRFEGFPRAAFIIDWILTFVFIGGLRVGIRLFLSEQEKGFSSLRQMFQLRSGWTFRKPEKGLVIIGAGDAGEKMLREIMDNARLHYEVLGFLDDDATKHGMKIHGVPVLGPVHKIHQLASQGGIDEILIALPSASAKQMKRIIETCEETGLKIRTTPSIGELIDGRISFKNVREVSFEDLLGRDVVNLDMKSIGDSLRGEVILVSGAAGSIGSELCRQITPFNPKNLILLDKTENSLFNVEMEFRQRFPHTFITPILGNVKHQNFLNKLFAAYKPQVVFHAAAYKHVPIVELNPWEAVFNNIVGTKNIVEASHQFEAERFIMISTDKAVRPSSVMGATKRVSEMITACYASSNPTKFTSVRFGNVIGSEGSVVHLFKKQIERLGPVTITHPEITRYFMTISEACKLILQAGAMGEGGEIFILDMGTPIKITNMARDLIRLSGFKPDEDIEIKFIGLRPGEKLYEELITEGEGIIQTGYEKIFVLRGNGCDRISLNQKIGELLKLAHEQDASAIKSKLKEIVPEYHPFNGNFPPPPPRNNTVLPPRKTLWFDKLTIKTPNDNVHP
jgi:FlaA1/EpsC-like NDP-sugar epimerase